MNCAFLGRLIPDEMECEVAKNSARNMQDAANALQWHLYDGLCQNTDKGIYIINVLPIGSFPQYYRKAFVRTSSFSSKYYKNNVNVGFCNIKLLRNYCLPSKITRELLKWCNEDKENRMVFMYTLSLPCLKAIQKVRKAFPSLRVCAIVADLPNMASLSSADNILIRCFRKLSSRSCYSKLCLIDAFTLLTQNMSDYMKISQPYCVVEGISTVPITEPDFQFSPQKKKIILYSGTLHKRFGIMNLINAFKAIRDDEYELVICGIGDAEKEICQVAATDKRIKYLGQKTRAEILELQQKAFLLVNPRQNLEEFTKYSFPSKNLEYLSSGRPLLAYKLDGIPDEYDEHIYYVNDNSVSALTEKMIEICELPPETLRKHCSEAYTFVQKEKNEIKQTRVILDMLKQEGIMD